ncbi:hypothetical protein PYR71_07605 [Rhizobium sp. MC63]|uniref:Uncharacterized protein n=1 Tax=Rhizobium mulingense TaxID=3031128 RepID=A0ACC6MRE1_9HYPH|nr:MULTISPECIES: hypothetical protein [unclassified Rhizobium]MDF0696383.1 hypothetical protein [Rhizobium sp. MC63]MEA3515797.1 hypothetical protein [Rhizobium sp. MJ31]
MSKRTKIGDVVQILTSKGVSYAQVTHKHLRYGHLLRAFDGFYADRLDNFSEVVASPVFFSAFFPVQKAVNEGLGANVGNSSVTDANSVFPIFRTSARDRDGRRGPLWLWNGETEVMLTRGLSNEEKEISGPRDHQCTLAG